MFSRGLLISLGVTTLSAALLFMYFNNKIKDVENKVQLMFDLIQNHTQNQTMTQDRNQDMTVEFKRGNNQEITQEEVQNSNLIEISDDDSDENSSDESDDDDDSEYEDDDNNNNNLEQTNFLEKSKDQIIAEEFGVKKPIEQLSNLMDDLPEINLNEAVLELKEQDNDSLDELSDLEEDTNLNAQELVNVKQDNESEEEQEQEQEEQQNLKKLTVAVLKNLAEKKGLTNYKSLKKAALVKLIEEN